MTMKSRGDSDKRMERIKVGIRRKEDWIDNVFIPSVLDPARWPAQIAIWLDDETIGNEVFMFGRTQYSSNVSYGGVIDDRYHDTAAWLIELAYQRHYHDVIPIDPTLGSRQSMIRFWGIFTEHLIAAFQSLAQILCGRKDPLRVAYGLVKLARSIPVPGETLLDTLMDDALPPILEPYLLTTIAKRQSDRCAALWETLMYSGEFLRLSEKAHMEINPTSYHLGTQTSDHRDWVRNIALNGSIGYAKYQFEKSSRAAEVDVLVEEIGLIVHTHVRSTDEFRGFWISFKNHFESGYAGAIENGSSGYPEFASYPGSYHCFLRTRLHEYAKEHQWDPAWGLIIADDIPFTIFSF